MIVALVLVGKSNRILLILLVKERRSDAAIATAVGWTTKFELALIAGYILPHSLLTKAKDCNGQLNLETVLGTFQ